MSIRCTFCGHDGPHNLFTVAHPTQTGSTAYPLCISRKLCRQRSWLAFTQLADVR